MNEKIVFLLLLMIFQANIILFAAAERPDSASSSIIFSDQNSTSSDQSSLLSSSANIDKLTNIFSCEDKIVLTNFQKIILENLEKVSDIQKRVPLSISQLIASYAPKMSSQEASASLISNILNPNLSQEDLIKKVTEAIECNADVNCSINNSYKYSPLWYAIHNFGIPNFEIIQLLVQAGANSKVKYIEAFAQTLIIYSPINDLIRVGLYEINEIEDEGTVKNKTKELIKTLKLFLENGADVNECYTLGPNEEITNLIHAAILNSPEVVKLLFDYNADPEIGKYRGVNFKYWAKKNRLIYEMYKNWKLKKAKENISQNLLPSSTGLSSSSSSSSS